MVKYCVNERNDDIGQLNLFVIKLKPYFAHRGHMAVSILYLSIRFLHIGVPRYLFDCAKYNITKVKLAFWGICQAKKQYNMVKVDLFGHLPAWETMQYSQSWLCCCCLNLFLLSWKTVYVFAVVCLSCPAENFSAGHSANLAEGSKPVLAQQSAGQREATVAHKKSAHNLAFWLK